MSTLSNRAEQRKSMGKIFTLLAAGPAAILLAACTATKPVTGEAYAAAAEVPALPSVELTEDILYDILVGEIAGQRGQFDIAIASLGRVAERTRDPRLAERATLAAVYAKRYNEALKNAELWVKLQPSSQQAHESLASILMEVNKPSEARRHLEKALSIAASEQTQDRAYRRIASVLGRHQNRQAAMEVMQALVDLDRANPNAYLALAHLAVRTDNLEAATGAISQALTLRPEWEEAALFKAGILVSKKDAVKAQAFYEEYLTQYPDSNQFRLNYARYLVDLKQWEKAREQFMDVLKASPSDADTIYAVGLLSLQTNRIDDAEKYLKSALRLRPENQQARIYLGQVAEDRKDYVEAARWYRQVVVGEHYFEAQTRLGVVIARQGHLEAAREHLHGIETQSDEQRVQLFLAEEQILREAKKYAEALETLNESLEALPRNQDLLYARALIGEKLDLVELAERDLRAILEQDPDNAQALNALGYTLADRTTRYKEALVLIERALALKPDDPFILDSMGWVQYRLGNNTEAIKYLKRALSIRNDAEISAHLGEVLWVTGDRMQARSVWKKALEDTPDNDTLLGIIKKFNP